MSSGGSGNAAWDGSATTAKAVGAFFGMVGFNLVLIAIALVLRRVTRRKPEESNSLEMKNGKYNRQKGNVAEDPEKGIEISNSHTNAGSTESATNVDKPPLQSSSGHHDNGAFVDIDLGNDSKLQSEPMYESRNKSEEANQDNDYSNLTDVNVTVKSDPEYENYDGDAAKASSATSEAGVMY